MAAEPVIATVHIDAEPERVYEYFTRPAAIVTWMGEYALLEAEPGGQFTVDVKGCAGPRPFLEPRPAAPPADQLGLRRLGPAAARDQHSRDPAQRRTRRHPGRA